MLLEGHRDISRDINVSLPFHLHRRYHLQLVPVRFYIVHYQTASHTTASHRFAAKMKFHHKNTRNFIKCLFFLKKPTLHDISIFLIGCQPETVCIILCFDVTFSKIYVCKLVITTYVKKLVSMAIFRILPISQLTLLVSVI